MQTPPALPKEVANHPRQTIADSRLERARDALGAFYAKPTAERFAACKLACALSGADLKAIREHEMHLSVQEMAEMLGVSRQTLWLWEKKDQLEHKDAMGVFFLISATA